MIPFRTTFPTALELLGTYAGCALKPPSYHRARVWRLEDVIGYYEGNVIYCNFVWMNWHVTGRWSFESLELINRSVTGNVQARKAQVGNGIVGYRTRVAIQLQADFVFLFLRVQMRRRTTRITRWHQQYNRDRVTSLEGGRREA